ncbi:hypothetical protein [Aureispira anguillae]|uniref:Uncharacterized protein n=1 Tax=Aureispira anguillae TaxID=2864201 RepID=A0A915YGS0_9BACT|nr:hypothetical protein [Aureispira anguillae]BDS12788.1 hypothetical protein AsAng_0035130 [Aureispira anguillae]
MISLQQCKQAPGHWQTEQPRIDTIVRIDTTPPKPIIIQLPRQEVPPPLIVYVDSSGQTVPTAKIDTSKHETARLYQDSIADDNLTLYYQSTVKGELLKNALDYKLKVPQIITKKIEVLKPYPRPVSTLLLTGGVGGNVNQFSSLSVGLQFVSVKGWAVGYDYDLLQNVHSVNLGVKLFQVKKRFK